MLGPYNTEEGARSARSRPDTVFERGARVQWCRLGNEVVLLDSSGRLLRALNGTGSRVWELVDGARPARLIAHELAGELQASADCVLEDVLAFLSQLADRSLVSALDEPSMTRGHP